MEPIPASGTITDTEMCLEWLEEDTPALLRATSEDASQYRGHYGYNSETQDDYEVYLKRQPSESGLSLKGIWQNRKRGGGNGSWIFNLLPEKD